MSFVRLHLFHPVANAVARSGNAPTEGRRFGLCTKRFRSQHSEFIAEGWLVRPPTLGRPVTVIRADRLELREAGVFFTQPVTGVGRGFFHTGHTAYRIENVALFEWN